MVEPPKIERHPTAQAPSAAMSMMSFVCDQGWVGHGGQHPQAEKKSDSGAALTLSFPHRKQNLAKKARSSSSAAMKSAKVEQSIYSSHFVTKGQSSESCTDVDDGYMRRQLSRSTKVQTSCHVVQKNM